MCFGDMFPGMLQVIILLILGGSCKAFQEFDETTTQGKHNFLETLWQGKERRTGTFIPSKGCPKTK